MESGFSSDLECPHCGTTFHYELTRCPNCGINIYFPEEEKDGELSQAFSNFIDTFRFPLGILAGWTAAIVLSLSIYLPIRFAFTMPQFGYIVYSIVVLCIGSGAFSGGFTAFRIAKKNVLVISNLVGLAGIGIAMVILLREWGTVIPFPSVTLGWMLILIASYAGARVAEKMLQSSTMKTQFVVQETEENLYQGLFIKVGYDHTVARRLIDYERTRAPKARRSQLIRNAIERWEKDNRAGGF